MKIFPREDVVPNEDTGDLLQPTLGLIAYQLVKKFPFASLDIFIFRHVP